MLILSHFENLDSLSRGLQDRPEHDELRAPSESNRALPKLAEAAPVGAASLELAHELLPGSGVRPVPCLGSQILESLFPSVVLPKPFQDAGLPVNIRTLMTSLQSANGR